MIYEKAYAKVNLSLNVFPKRADGYHEVKTIMVPLDLYDELYFEDSSEFIYNANVKYDNDICLKVYDIMNKMYHFTRGVKITLSKHIPSEAGLAGGSADAAALVRGLNRYYNLNMTLDDMYQVVNQVGSDVAYCISNRPSICSGRGEIVSFLDINKIDIDILLIKPNFGASTALVYKNYIPQNIDRNENDSNIIKAIKDKNIKLLEDNIYNDLKEPCLKVSEAESIIFKELEALGLNVYLSGSGTTIYTFDVNDENISKFIDNHQECKFIRTKIKYFT